MRWPSILPTGLARSGPTGPTGLAPPGRGLADRSLAGRSAPGDLRCCPAAPARACRWPWLAALILFARAWVREFAYLMRLGDDAFPGRNDKLIWAILLIVLPPVGVWLFRAYREAHWPEAKPAKARAEAFDY